MSERPWKSGHVDQLESDSALQSLGLPSKRSAISCHLSRPHLSLDHRLFMHMMDEQTALMMDQSADRDSLSGYCSSW